MHSRKRRGEAEMLQVKPWGKSKGMIMDNHHILRAVTLTVTTDLLLGFLFSSSDFCLYYNLHDEASKCYD